MDNRKTKIIYCLSIISIFLSVATIVLFFIKVSPNSVIDPYTFISTLVGLITLGTTFVIGYQIYNAIDLREKLEEIDILKNKIEAVRCEFQENMNSSLKRLEFLENELKEAVFISYARMFSSKAGLSVEALCKFIYGIKYSLSVAHNEGYNWLLDELKFYMLNIVPISFGNYDVKNKAMALRKIIEEESKEIEKHPNYLYIKNGYEELVDRFYIRLSILAQNKNVSTEELDKEF